jgi:plastocyanin
MVRAMVEAMARARASWLRMAVASVGAAMLLTAVGASSGVRAQAAMDVPIQAFVFQPAAIVVPVGTTVTWTNLDPVDHTVTDVNGSYDSGLFGEAGTWSMTFTMPGTYTYYCIPHPMMIGTVEVQ